MHSARAWGLACIRAAKKWGEAKVRDDGGFVFLSPSLATSVCEVLFVFFCLVTGLEPAAWA